MDEEVTIHTEKTHVIKPPQQQARQTQPKELIDTVQSRLEDNAKIVKIEEENIKQLRI